MINLQEGYASGSVVSHTTVCVIEPSRNLNWPYHISRAEGKTVVSQTVVFPQTKSPHHEGIMKITTFLSVNNENLGAIARMSNGTLICIVYNWVKVAPKQGFKKYVWVILQSCYQPSICPKTKRCCTNWLVPMMNVYTSYNIQHFFKWIASALTVNAQAWMVIHCAHMTKRQLFA